MKIQLPAGGWKCRPYQDEAWRYLMAGGKRYVGVNHRRWGKDKLSLNWTAVSAFKRVGVYWHMLPEAAQARKAIWEAVDEFTGIRLIDQAFPKELRESTRESDMFIRFKNGSTWQVVGSDNYQSLLGSPPVGVVFSEFAYADPECWSKISPILDNNGGWAIFISTPFGRNHFYGLYQYAKRHDGWLAQLQDFRHTKVFTQQQIDNAEELEADLRQSRADAKAIIRQEYYCDFNAAIPGAVFGEQLEEMEKSDPPRILPIAYNPGFAVEVSSDLGASEGNDMALWWYQVIGRETVFLDCDSAVGVGIDWFAEKLAERQRDRKFIYLPTQTVKLPHDAGHPQPSNKGAASFAKKLYQDYGYTSKVNVVTPSKAWSITRARHAMKNYLFDSAHCEAGLHALRSWHRKYDKVRKCYQELPFHDWSSNYSDAFLTKVESEAGPAKQRAALPVVANAFDPWEHHDRNQRQYAIGADDDPLGRNF